MQDKNNLISSMRLYRDNEGDRVMSKISNQELKRLNNQLKYFQATKQESKAREIQSSIKDLFNKRMGLYTSHLQSKSYLIIKQIKVNSFSPYYNKGDYYYSPLDCITLRK